ncbi:hypothetical protein KBD75_01335 [Candidatus Woesebacteria bacterium]|nr:hypothetical protein [Candidatus Woesebacteria bacterium]
MTLVTPMPTSQDLNAPLTPTVVPTPTLLQFDLHPGEIRRATNGSLELEIQYLGTDQSGSGHWVCSTKVGDGNIVDCGQRIGESQEMVFVVGGEVVARAMEGGEVKFTDSDWKQSPSSTIAP